MHPPGVAGMLSTACRTPAGAVPPNSPSRRAPVEAGGSATAQGAALATAIAGGPEAVQPALSATRAAAQLRVYHVWL
jgi:hypothetical protein